MGIIYQQFIKVVILDDNIVNEKVATRMLSLMGCEVETAANGEIAVEKWQSNTYDLILMDCLMPVMDGYQATSNIRDREMETEHIPILALTASALIEDHNRCIAAGMDSVISKPVTINQLHVALQDYL